MDVKDAGKLERDDKFVDEADGLGVATTFARAGVIVTPDVARPDKIALVSIIVTFSLSTLAALAEEAKAWRVFGSSMVTT